jgi:hypothetical protein
MKQDSTKLKMIKILDESKSRKSQADFLRQLLNNEPYPDENKIISYLQTGKLLFFRPFELTDCLDKNRKIIGDCSIYTDGIWLWKRYLSYFVRVHYVKLPDDFIAHMSLNKWKVPFISSEHEKSLVAETVDLLHLKQVKFE